MNQTKSREEKDKEAKEAKEDVIKSIISVLSNGNSRLVKMKDPATRYTVLLDRLCLIADIGFSILDTNIDNAEILESARSETDFLKTELGKLIDWISIVNLAPDQPRGEHLMKQTGEHFMETLPKSPS